MLFATRRRASAGWTKFLAVFAIGTLFFASGSGVTKGTHALLTTRIFSFPSCIFDDFCDEEMIVRSFD
jgi:hypothetical protein